MNGRACFGGRNFGAFLTVLLPAFASLSVTGMVIAMAIFRQEVIGYAALLIGFAAAAVSGALAYWAAVESSTVAPAPEQSAPPARKPHAAAAWAPRPKRQRYAPKALPAPGASAAKAAPKAGHLVAMNQTVRVAGSKRDRILAQLRQAMAGGQLRLFYQPIVSLDTLSLAGAEALLRIETADGELLPPADIIRVAEDTGLMGELGAWIVAEGLATVAALDRTSGAGVQYLSINLSQRQLDPEFMGDLVENLKRAPGTARRLVFEITESVLLEGDERMIRSFHDIRDTGARIALDDFGTGYASLGYVNRYPVDFIKLDRGIIHNLSREGSAEARQNLALVKAAAVMAKELGVVMIAEGIETPEEFETLRSLGIGFGQGYLFAAPMPESAYREWAMAFTRPKSKCIATPLRLISAA